MMTLSFLIAFDRESAHRTKDMQPIKSIKLISTKNNIDETYLDNDDNNSNYMWWFPLESMVVLYSRDEKAKVSKYSSMHFIDEVEVIDDDDNRTS